MGTNIGRALELARNNLFGKSARPGIPNMLIVLTDGQSQDPVTDAAQRLRDSAVTIFTVGIGNGYDIGQLRDMATDPDSQHVYKATFNNLDEVVKAIKDRACMGKLTLDFVICFLSRKPFTSLNVKSLFFKNLLLFIFHSKKFYRL